MTEAECFDGKLVLQASAVVMIEPKQTAERILGHLMCWNAPEMYVLTTKRGRSVTCLRVKLCVHSPPPKPEPTPPSGRIVWTHLS